MARPRTTSDEAIVSATARAVSRHGLAKLTLATVAEEVGLAPATLVQRFGSKRGLLLALARQAGPGSRRPFARARDTAESPLAALHEALAQLTSGVRDPEQMANNLSFLQLDLADPEFRAHAATHLRIVREEVAALLVAAVTAGELAAGTDTERLARAVQAAYNGALIMWGLAGEGALTEALHVDIDHVLEPYRASTTSGRTRP